MSSSRQDKALHTISAKHYNKSRLFAPTSVSSTIEAVKAAHEPATLILPQMSNAELTANLLLKNLVFNIKTNGPDTRFSHFTNLLLRNDNRNALVDNIISECEAAKTEGKVKDVNSYEARLQKLREIKNSSLVATHCLKK